MPKPLLAKKISLVVGSLSAFLQIGCAFLLGTMIDMGLANYPIWGLATLGMIVGSVFMCFYARGLAYNKDGYRFGQVSIPSSYWYLYSLLIACVLCFALFGLLSLIPRAELFTHISFIGLALPTLVAIIDGFAYFAAHQIARRDA